MIYKFRNLSDIIHLLFLKILYCALVVVLWSYSLGAASATLMNNLQKDPKSILKKMYKTPRTYPSAALYDESGILSVYQLFAKVIRNSPGTIQRKIEFDTHQSPLQYKERSNAILPRTEKQLVKNVILF